MLPLSRTTPRGTFVERQARYATGQRPVTDGLAPHNPPGARPKLTLDNIPDYLDWLVDQASGMHERTLGAHMQAAEMVVRLHAIAAQGKATQHTLVEDGTLAPEQVAVG